MKTKATEQLSTILKDGIDVHRCAAARALGGLGGPLAIAGLTDALLDEDPDVRVDAVSALAEIQTPEAAEKLMENLIGDPDADVKKAAIQALVALRHAPVVPLLRALAVSRAEDQITWDEEAFYIEGWDSWDDIQISAIRGLGAFEDEAAITDILEAMSDEQGQDISEPAFEALAQMGSEGAQALAQIYSLDDPRLSRRIARAAGRSDNPHIAVLHGEMLLDKSPQIRALALESLPSTDTRLARLFNDPDAIVRAAAVRHHGAANLLGLRGMILDEAPQVRLEVFKIIAAHPDEFREKPLIDAIKSTLKGDPDAARAAALALFALKGAKVAKGFTHVLGQQDIPREFRIGILETLEKAGDIAVPALLTAAADPDRQLRLASLTTLANIAAEGPTWPNDAGLGLLTALKGELVLPPEEPEEEEIIPDPKPEPDQAELDAIAAEIDQSLPLVPDDAAPGSTLRAIMVNQPGEPAAEPEEIKLDPTQERLLAATNTRKLNKRKVSWQTEVAPYLDVRRFSARLLGQVVQPDVTEALIDTLENAPDVETLEAALFSLAEHGTKLGHLPARLTNQAQALLDHKNSDIRVLATRILGFLPTTENDQLATLTRHQDQLVRVEAIRALDRRNVAHPALNKALNDDYLGAGIAAARALARLKGGDAVDDLVEFATRNDGTYRRDIGRLLGQYAPNKGAARLLDLMRDETRKSEWLVAIDALSELFQHQTPEQSLLVA